MMMMMIYPRTVIADIDRLYSRNTLEEEEAEEEEEASKKV